MNRKNKALVFSIMFLVGLIIASLLTFQVSACKHDNKWKKYDLNKDGKVDIIDFVIFGAFYGTSKGQSSYWKKCDFNGNGIIDIFDAVMMAQWFGYPLH